MVTLHQEQVRRTNAEPGSRDEISLQTSRRLAWDTCQIPMEPIKEAGIISRLSFVSMCCAFRAMVVVLDTAAEPPSLGDMAMSLGALDQFRRRWKVGGMSIVAILPTKANGACDKDAFLCGIMNALARHGVGQWDSSHLANV